jgi:signal transduction histidine kinase
MHEAPEDIGSKPADPEQTRRGLLAGAIERRLHDIESRWLEEVAKEVGGRGPNVTGTDLRNAIGEYLSRLSEALRGSQSIEAGGTAAWVNVAREHALTRVRLGFDIDQLVREFILLRRVLFDAAREERVIENDKQAERLTDLIDAAIATAVKSYVDSRDIAARRIQAEHIGFVTHELRNPLATAMMTAARLRKQADVAAAHGDLLDVLDRSLNRIRSQIDGILLAQRLEAHEMESRPVDISLGRIMEEATQAAGLAASEKGVVFEAHYDPEIAVHVDPGLTTSALQNVIDNAVKFTDRGHVEVRTENHDTEVSIHVYDDCDGLSPEELKTIFEPFKRAHPGKAGTGLGLAIARRALEAQGGRISAESGGERGCHFWLTLPKPLQ